MSPRKMKICLIAGEVSGDSLGASLMQDLKEKLADVEFCGVGGDAMAEQGLSSLFSMRDLSVMGIMEVVPRLPLILRRIRQTTDYIVKEQPDLVITIDSPDFCFRVAKALKDRAVAMPKMVHYVAPTVWAWRPERAAKVASLYDAILCLFPMEPAYFENEGMKACFVGHPAVAKWQAGHKAHDIRAELKIPQSHKIIGFLPGSRMSELNRVGPVLREALSQYAEEEQRGLNIIALTLPHLSRETRYLLQGFKARIHIIDDQKLKWSCFEAMDGAVAASGTVGLELGVAGVPHLIGYKVNSMTYRLVRFKITTKYAHLVNILQGKEVVPEFIQENCKADLIAASFKNVMQDNTQQKAAFSQIREMLACDRQNMKAADFIVSEVLAA